MGIQFANTFLYVFVLFRVCSCASIFKEDSRMEGTSSDSWTTLGTETYSSGSYETETDYRTVNVQTTHDVEIRNGTKDQSNPCLDSHNDFCIHGICQYHSELKSISCICHTGFTGERCHSFTLEVKHRKVYDLPTILTVAVVIVSCLTIFGLLLVIRHQKKHKHDVKCEEKIHLKVTPSP